MLKQVGDVDLIVETRYRFPDDTHEEMQQREERLCRALGVGPQFLGLYSTELDGPRLIDRISPYTSVVSRSDTLGQLQQKGEAYRLIYSYDN
jgi:hypothetical protein